MPRITEIILYPIKSCAGFAVGSAQLEARGFAGDRRYMLVDERGRFLTQREHSKMARISVRPSNRGWAVDAPGCATLELPESLSAEEECPVIVWHDRLELAVAGAAVNDWFSEVMGFPCRLVNMHERHRREVREGRGAAGDLVSLADGAPVLLTSQASLAELNERLADPLVMRRFRPNLVISAERAFAEDSWGRIRVGEAEFDVAWACTRCVVTTIDPETGEKDPHGEPLMTLKGFRRGPEGVMFGQNLIPRRLGSVRVGDSIERLEGNGE